MIDENENQSYIIANKRTNEHGLGIFISPLTNICSSNNPQFYFDINIQFHQSVRIRVLVHLENIIIISSNAPLELISEVSILRQGIDE